MIFAVLGPVQINFGIGNASGVRCMDQDAARLAG